MQIALISIVTVLITTAGAVLVAWFRGAKQSDGKTAELAVATLDSSAVNRLATAMEKLVHSVHDLKNEVGSSKAAASRMADQLDRSLKQHGDEVSRHREEMIRSKSAKT